MKRDKMRHLMMELCRRMYLQRHGSLKGWGKDAKFYNRNWMPDVNKFGGYKATWESKVMRDLRNSVGM